MAPARAGRRAARLPERCRPATAEPWSAGSGSAHWPVRGHHGPPGAPWEGGRRAACFRRAEAPETPPRVRPVAGLPAGVDGDGCWTRCSSDGRWSYGGTPPSSSIHKERNARRHPIPGCTGRRPRLPRAGAGFAGGAGAAAGLARRPRRRRGGSGRPDRSRLTMTLGHRHAGDAGLPSAPAVRRTVVAILIPLMAATVAGLVLLWPRGDLPQVEGAQRSNATILEINACAEQVEDADDCREARVRVGRTELRGRRQGGARRRCRHAAGEPVRAGRLPTRDATAAAGGGVRAGGRRAFAPGGGWRAPPAPRVP